MKVDSVDSNPRKILIQPISTNAVLGTLKKYEAGYIIGVTAHLQSKISKIQQQKWPPSFTDVTIISVTVQIQRTQGLHTLQLFSSAYYQV